MRVAVLGAGYAGLTVARRLERRLPEDVELVVVDESGEHLVQHELHRLVRHPGLADVITLPLTEVLPEATVRQARVTDVDPEAGVATLDPVDGDGREELRYDAAAVCLGAETAFYGLEGVEANATPLKRVPHAEAIRADALAAPGGNAVVGGAGLSGVQVAGELAELSEAEGLDLDVTLVEMADRIAPRFDETFAGAVREELEARGVAVETGATVENADAETVALADGRTLPQDVFVWAGGIRGPDALDGERRPTGGDLRVGDGTFVVGDAAEVVDAAGTEVPASAQTAVREARTTAANIRRVLNAARVADEAGDDAPERFDRYAFEEAGWVVSVGDGAVAQVGPVILAGDPARAIKAVIGAGHLGSVGAIEEATELVHEELSWPDGKALSPFVARLEEFTPAGADPSSLGHLESQLLGPFVGLAESLGGDATVDLTDLTRLGDRSYPGSPADLLQRTVFDPVESAAELEAVMLDVPEDSEEQPGDR
ncbi:NADH dehydrogenase FAD-containing subunit [Halobacteriales archaeon QS_9_68_42]|nr:MAG: NADH dehydrogenase FAD-containing subunit [Halobacteriales archaeon QS_9_68_42]